MNDKTELQNIIEHAFDFISDIRVRGDDVEKMAEARAALRHAFKLAGQEKEAKNG